MQQQQNQRLDASIRDRIAELQAANQLGLDTLREFWGNPDIRLGFKAWWISISSFDERVQMVTAAYNSAQIKKSDDDADEDFLQLNEQAAYRIQVMVTQELQDLSALAKLGETGDGILIDVLEALVDGRENAVLLAPLQPAVKRQIDEELAADLHLLTQLSNDIKVIALEIASHAPPAQAEANPRHNTNSAQSNHLLVDAIFDRLEERFRNHHLSSVPYLLRLRIQRLAALDSSAHHCPIPLRAAHLCTGKRSASDVEFITQLIMESLPHTRTFALTRFFACLINEFIQVIMSPKGTVRIASLVYLIAYAITGNKGITDELERSLSTRCDFCGETTQSIKKCARCHLRQYCGKECQAGHWRLIHKDECMALAVQRENRRSDGSKEA